ncbi:CRISPR-associated endonuclease Cas2 [Staphylospora marina]|uniref:CRISPR-associated endonuclease Cas2 n=1 Tax=Staphylospora marina TaxID=2490858 RepID=UPI000F5BA1FD|nr:CRISPR-associated endonuclease Cas2 [Staphylospora marina]
MFVIVVYDVQSVRVAKVKKICHPYLFWVQRSTFEGNLSRKQVQALKKSLEDVIHPDHDQVKMYIIQQDTAVQTEVLGCPDQPEPFMF